MVSFERTEGGFFGYGMTRGGVLREDAWSSISGQWNETRYGIPNFHRAIDLVANMGDDVYALGNGIVSHIRLDDGDGVATTNPFGNVVIIDLDAGGAIAVCHLSQINVALNEGVLEGDVIGLVGSTGNSTGPHVHLQCSEQAHGSAVLDRPDLAVDPIEFMTAVCALPDDAPLPIPELPLLSGGVLPAAGQRALLVLARDCAPQEVVDYGTEQGTAIRFIWVVRAGAWHSYIVGAPAAVNATFPALTSGGAVMIVA